MTELLKVQGEQRRSASGAPKRAVVGRGCIFLLCSFVAAHMVGDPAAGQKIPREQLTVRETVDVRVVHLDAVVTNRSLEPIEDLEPSDFDLRVDGQKVQVTGVSQGSELRETVGGRLTVVVFLDERHLQGKHRNLVLAEIGEALVGEMRDHSTWVALTTFLDTLEPVLGPTRDVAAVQAAIHEVIASKSRVPPELRLQQRAATYEVRDMLRGLSNWGTTYRFSQASIPAVTARLRSYGEDLATDTRRTLRGAESLVEALSFVPGRKAVIFLSEGLPREPLDLLAKTLFDRLVGGSAIFDGDEIVADRTGTVATNDPSNRPTGSERVSGWGDGSLSKAEDGGALAFQKSLAQLSLAADFDRLAALANTHRVTFYPLKPPVSDARLTGLGEGAGERGSITAISDMAFGLQNLADLTGGLAFTAGGRVGDFLRQARADAESYYSISFTPPPSMWNSGIRELELKVRGRKTRVRHRASYVPLTVQQRLSSRAWSTLLFESEENSHGLEVDTSLRATGEAINTIEVLAKLPIGKLELVANGGAVAGVFRMVIQLRGQDGLRLQPRHFGFVVSVPNEDLETARRQLFVVRTELNIPAGVWDMVVGLWEEYSGQSSFVVQTIEVGRKPAEVARSPKSPRSLGTAWVPRFS